jgi:hypothetical protein
MGTISENFFAIEKREGEIVMESNIFKALKMAQDEVLMCRFLADLLDPKEQNKLDTSI